MTLKDIAKQLTTAVQTVPNLVQILRDGLEQATAGSSVEVTQVVSSGTKIASVKVDNETTDLYAPSAVVNYSTEERIIGKYIDGTTDVYTKFYDISDYTIGTAVDLSIPDTYTIIEGTITAKLIGSAQMIGSYNVVSYVNPQGNNSNITIEIDDGNYTLHTNIPAGEKPAHIFIKLIYIKPAA